MRGLGVIPATSERTVRNCTPSDQNARNVTDMARELVWLENATFAAWGCKACGWIMHGSPPPISGRPRGQTLRKPSTSTNAVSCSGEKSTGFRDGTLRCDGCGEEFFIGHNPKSVDKRIAEKQAKGWKKFWRKNTSAIRSTPTESNCRTSCLSRS